MKKPLICGALLLPRPVSKFSTADPGGASSELSGKGHDMIKCGFQVSAGLIMAAASFISSLHATEPTPQPLRPSPGLALAMPSGPDANVKIAEGYARMVARDAYFWAWPMVNADFSLFMRTYWPKTEVLDGTRAPPAVQKIADGGSNTVGKQK